MQTEFCAPTVRRRTVGEAERKTSDTVYGAHSPLSNQMRLCTGPLQSQGLRLHFGSMPKLYRVEGFDAPQVVPVLSGILTHDEAKKYRADLTARGVHPSDIWITEVDEQGAAKNIKKLPRPY